MNPDDIKLESTEKEFEYVKYAHNIQRITDPDQLRGFALYFAKLYLRQQEIVHSLASWETGGGI